MPTQSAKSTLSQGGRKRPEGEGDFHVVARHVYGHDDKIVRGKTRHEIYCNNVPFLKGSGKPLSHREAEWIAGILNERCKRTRRGAA